MFRAMLASGFEQLCRSVLSTINGAGPLNDHNSKTGTPTRNKYILLLETRRPIQIARGNHNYCPNAYLKSVNPWKIVIRDAVK